MNHHRTPHVVDVHIGQRIRLARRSQEMSQEALGQSCGITFQQVQKYERGTNRVSGSMLWMIAKTQQQPISFYYEGLPENPVEENAADREIRTFAQSPRGAAILQAAMHLPAPVAMAHVEAMQAASAALSVANEGLRQDA